MSERIARVDFITSRELSQHPGKVMRRVQADGPQVITQNGVPAAYLIPTSGRGIEDDLAALRRLLLGRALDATQVEAARAGTDTLSRSAIDAEIAAARKERRTPSAPEE